MITLIDFSKLLSPETFSMLADKGLGFAGKLVGAIAVLVIGLWIVGKVTALLKKTMEKNNVDKSLVPFLTSLVSSLLKVLVFLSAASMLGFELTSFVAILGAMAFAVGMALQGSLGNFAGGVLILLLKPFRVGDLITAMGHTGFVEEIEIFATTLKTPDNKKIILPNGTLQSSAIENISTLGEISVWMTFGIGYGDDIDKARAVIQEVSDRCPNLLPGKDTTIAVSELGDSSVNFAVRPWTTPAHFWDVHGFFHEEIKKAFDKNAIGIPYPTMDVNVFKN